MSIFGWDPTRQTLFIFFLVFSSTFVGYRLSGTANETPLNEHAPANFFSEARVRTHLKIISVDHAPRPANSENNDKVREYIISFFNSLKNTAQTNGWDLDLLLPNETVSMCTQSGHGLVEPTNVVIRLKPGNNANGPLLPSVLLNTHYDSVFGAPGATDAGTGVAVMMEIGRAVSASPAKSIQRPLVLLFNNAEEVWRVFRQEPFLCCVGSRAFMATHPWSRDIGIALNLEGVGAGGPPQVVRTNSVGLLKLYNRMAGHPLGSVLYSDLFRSGFVDSDTDYHAAWEPAGIPSLDLISLRRHAAYHTIHDSFDNILPGSIQVYGNNVLSTVRALLSSPTLTEYSVHSANSTSWFTPVYKDLPIGPMVVTDARALGVVLALITMYVLSTGLGNQSNCGEHHTTQETKLNRRPSLTIDSTRSFDFLSPLLGFRAAVISLSCGGFFMSAAAIYQWHVCALGYYARALTTCTGHVFLCVGGAHMAHSYKLSTHRSRIPLGRGFALLFLIFGWWGISVGSHLIALYSCVVAACFAPFPRQMLCPTLLTPPSPHGEKRSVLEAHVSAGILALGTVCMKLVVQGVVPCLLAGDVIGTVVHVILPTAVDRGTGFWIVPVCVFFPSAIIVASLLALISAIPSPPRLIRTAIPLALIVFALLLLHGSSNGKAPLDAESVGKIDVQEVVSVGIGRNVAKWKFCTQTNTVAQDDVTQYLILAFPDVKVTCDGGDGDYHIRCCAHGIDQSPAMLPKIETEKVPEGARVCVDAPRSRLARVEVEGDGAKVEWGPEGVQRRGKEECGGTRGFWQGERLAADDRKWCFTVHHHGLAPNTSTRVSVYVHYDEVHMQPRYQAFQNVLPAHVAIFSGGTLSHRVHWVAEIK